MIRKITDPWAVAAGLVVVLAVVGLTGFLIIRLSETATPVVIAAVLTAFAGVLATLPPVIRALRGR